MLSVELRTGLERLLENGYAQYLTKIDAVELRALLDKPEPKRKPFAWYRVPKDFPLQGAYFPYIEGQSERDIQNSLEAEFGFNVKRLYDEPAAQHQGYPVNRLTYSKGDRRYVNGWNDACSHWEEKTAPVAPFNPDTVVCRRYTLEQSPGQNFYHYDLDPVYGSAPVTISELITLAESAPVAVVMPERREPSPSNPHLSDADHEYNSALDDVARLNGVTP